MLMVLPSPVILKIPTDSGDCDTEGVANVSDSEGRIHGEFMSNSVGVMSLYVM